MKKTYLLFAGMASILFGCKKDYTCACSWTYTEVNTTTGQVLESSNGIDGTPIIIKDVKKSLSILYLKNRNKQNQSNHS